MKFRKPLTLLLMIFSSGCATVERPDTDMCVVNVPGEHAKCYNLKRDYNDDGSRNPSAIPTYRPIDRTKKLSLDDLNKNTCVDPDGLANLKSYIRELRDAYERECK